MESLQRQSGETRATSPLPYISEAGHARAITDSLTISKESESAVEPRASHNPQLTPIVEVDGGLFLLSALIPITMPNHHNLKLLQVAYRGKPITYPKATSRYGHTC